MNKEQQYFDQFAERRDNPQIADLSGIEQLVNIAGIGKGDRVLGIGCDTGILIPRIRKAVGDAGRLTVLDESIGTGGKAAEKYRHVPGVFFVAADIMKYHHNEAYNQIICFNSFPRINERQSFLIKLRGLLAEDGFLVITHDTSLSAVNGMGEDSASVKDDRFPPTGETAGLLESLSYLVVDVVDNGELYIVKACKR